MICLPLRESLVLKSQRAPLNRENQCESEVKHEAERPPRDLQKAISISKWPFTAQIIYWFDWAKVCRLHLISFWSVFYRGQRSQTHFWSFILMYVETGFGGYNSWAALRPVLEDFFQLRPHFDQFDHFHPVTCTRCTTPVFHCWSQNSSRGLALPSFH